MMKRFPRSRQLAKQTKRFPYTVNDSILNIFDDVSDFVVDGLKAFPLEDGEDNDAMGRDSRKIS